MLKMSFRYSDNENLKFKIKKYIINKIYVLVHPLQLYSFGADVSGDVSKFL